MHLMHMLLLHGCGGQQGTERAMSSKVAESCELSNFLHFLHVNLVKHIHNEINKSELVNNMYLSFAIFNPVLIQDIDHGLDPVETQMAQGCSDR